MCDSGWQPWLLQPFQTMHYRNQFFEIALESHQLPWSWLDPEIHETRFGSFWCCDSDTQICRETQLPKAFTDPAGGKVVACDLQRSGRSQNKWQQVAERSPQKHRPCLQRPSCGTISYQLHQAKHSFTSYVTLEKTLETALIYERDGTTERPPPWEINFLKSCSKYEWKEMLKINL